MIYLGKYYRADNLDIFGQAISVIEVYGESAKVMLQVSLNPYLAAVVNCSEVQLVYIKGEPKINLDTKSQNIL